MLDGPQYLAAAILFTILVLVLTVVCFFSRGSKGPDHSASGPKEQDRSISDPKEQRALELDMSLMEETKEATGGDPPMLAQDEPKPGLYAVFLGITEAFLEEGGVHHFTKKVLKKMLRLREAEDKSRPRLDGGRVTVWSGTAWIVEVDENAPYNLSTPDDRPAVATNDKLGVLYIVCVMALIHLFSDKKPKEGTLKYKRDLIAKLSKLLYFGRRGETIAGWCFNEDNSLSGIYTVFLRNLDRLGKFEEPFDPFHIAKNLGEAWVEFDKIAADPSSPASASTASSVESFEQLSPNAQCILRSVRKIMKKEVEKGVRVLSQQLDFAETEADRRNDQQISEHQATRDKTAKLETTVTSGLGNLQQGTQLLAQTLMPYLDKIGQTVRIDLNDGELHQFCWSIPRLRMCSHLFVLNCTRCSCGGFGR